MQRLLVMLICSALSGCATLTTLDEPNNIYGGTREDADCIFGGRHVGTDTSGFEVFCLLDLPLSLALDTLILPITFIDTLTGEDEQEEK